MKSKPLVSVIVNCFNGEKYLSEAIDSVLSQNYINWESILKVEMYIEELKKWYKKNSDSYKKSNIKSIKAFYSSILYKEYNFHINNNSFSFSFAMLLSAFKKLSLKNVLKIIIKIFIKKITGVRV